MEIEKQYDEIGKDYSKHQKLYTSKREHTAVRFIQDRLGVELNDKVVLDVGCGDGGDIAEYEKLCKSVFGIDYSETMVDLAKQNVRDIENIFHGSVEELPFDDEMFDVVTSRFALHYLKDLSKAYNELSRVLKPGGSLIFIVHHPFRDLGYQKEKKYGKQEIVSIDLYDLGFKNLTQRVH